MSDVRGPSAEVRAVRWATIVSAVIGAIIAVGTIAVSSGMAWGGQKADAAQLAQRVTALEKARADDAQTRSAEVTSIDRRLDTVQTTLAKLVCKVDPADCRVDSGGGQ